MNLAQGDFWFEVKIFVDKSRFCVWVVKERTSLHLAVCNVDTIIGLPSFLM